MISFTKASYRADIDEGWSGKPVHLLVYEH